MSIVPRFCTCASPKGHSCSLTCTRCGLKREGTGIRPSPINNRPYEDIEVFADAMKDLYKRAEAQARKYGTVYQRIIDAAKRGKGMRLSAEEVYTLSQSASIASTADHDTYREKGRL
jgi:hypothetical protein